MDLKPLKDFLEIEFSRLKKGNFTNKKKYVIELLKDTKLLGCQMLKTPIKPNLRLQ